MKLKEGTVVIVNGKFAEPMGYQDFVGVTGMVGLVESSVSQVSILDGDSDFFGSTIEVHNNDLLIEELDRPVLRHGAFYMYSDLFMHTTSLDKYNFLANSYSHSSIFRLPLLCSNIDNLVTMLTNLGVHGVEGKEVVLCSIDDNQHPEAIKFNEAYDLSLFKIAKEKVEFLND